jgi:imidazolonepropionase-like amidohydrolase
MLACAARPDAAGAPVTVIRNVTVIDGTGAAPRPNLDVVIAGETIAAIEPAGRSYGAEATVIDGTGKYVIPGLVDMHAHLLVNHTNEKGEVAPRYDQAATIDHLALFLRYGVTTVRDPGSRTADAVLFRRLVAEGKIAGPTIFTAGRILNSSNFNPEPFVITKDERAIRDEIHFQAAAGVDFVKVYSSMTPDLLKVAVDEARRHQLPVVGHVQRTTWTEAARLGIAGIEHAAPWSREYVREADREAMPGSMFGRVYWLEHLDQSAIDEMVAELARHRVVVDPTLMAMHTKFWGDDPRWTKNPELSEVSEAVRTSWTNGRFTGDWTPEQYARAQRSWPVLLGLTKAMYDRGVHLVAGTDTPTPWIVPGASLHSELELLADAGIPPLQVLHIATQSAAKALRREQEFGAVLPGLRADLILLSKNPLDAIGNTRSIELVFQRGRAVHRARGER